ncbi:MAG: biotin--[acetyl-CoA-carboxylase] ligase [Spirochaetales bacterium]|nr:biotin--[acetyl-CoA-carboxylase] ligase [Spirochaetales bacterium]
MNLKKIINPFGGLTFYNENTVSTMLDAKELMNDQNIDGSLVLTDYQSGGMGRIYGRRWLSKPGENLMFTLVLSMDYLGHGYSTVPLKTGLALCKTVKELTKLDAKVKWPNDIVVDGKKLSGVLCQSKGQSILIGVGININQLDFDNEIKDKATSFSLLTNNGYNLEMVLSEFLSKFNQVLKDENWLSDLNSHLYKLGETVSFAKGNANSGEIITGKLEGLDGSGRVVILKENGEVENFLSGEFL